MLKQHTIPLEDSNIAGLGGAADHAARERAAQSETEFKGAGDAVGVEIWRIEAFVPKRQPLSNTFFGGDAYIVLHTYMKKDKKAWNLHFWLGGTSSQDEQGAAAYLTVALDDLLGGHPVQFRETQGNESPEFTGMFPSLVILDGGVASGFAHVTPETYQSRLMHIKGTAKTVRASQVPLGAASLNEGDAFLLDAGLQIWVWNGKEAGPFEKRKAAEMAASMASDRKGKAKVQVLESGDTDAPFWTAMGGAGAVASAAAAGADSAVGKAPPKSLWRLSDNSGVLTMSELARERFGKAQLSSDDVFFVDVGHTVYVWIGKGTSKNEKAKAIAYGALFLSREGRPATTPVVRLVEGGETTAFDSCFDA